MPRSYGHMVGCNNLEKMCDDLQELGIRYLTVYAFSTENWKRSRMRSMALMKLFRRYLKRCQEKRGPEPYAREGSSEI